MHARKIVNKGGKPGAPDRRRLAAVAFIDIVGYSILMARDGGKTVDRWIAILEEIVRPLTKAHHGRVVKSTGDGVLADFRSARDAVVWAREVQDGVRTRDPTETAAPIVLRIAVHVGDVVDRAGDIFGDGVNVAARLQEFADPGGIVISETVHDILRGTPGINARDLGLLQLKNFEKPVRAYALATGRADLAVPALPVQHALPSIAVLPLQNLSGDARHAYFADGIIEDIIVSLASLHELLVISRGSTLRYQGQQVDPREVGRALGVRYVLTGTLRMSGTTVRVSVHLSDSVTGANLWSHRSEAHATEIFDLQDRVVVGVVAGIAPNIQAAELRAALRKRPESFNAYDLTLRALAIINHADRAVFWQAREHLDRAIAEAPDFAMPLAWCARWYSLCVGQGWSSDPDGDGRRAGALAARAVECDGHNALALATYGHVQSFIFHDYDSALHLLERARSVCPSAALAWVLSSVTLSYVDRAAEAIAHADHALLLSPFDPKLFTFHSALGFAHFTADAHDEAVKWLRLSASENAGFTANMRMLAAALVAAGRPDEAHAVAAELLRHEPEFRVDAWQCRRQPYRDAARGARYADLLRRAGLPA